MKRVLLLAAFLLAVLAMAAVGAALGRHFGCRTCGAAGETGQSCAGQSVWLTETLKLTAAQQTAVRQLDTEYRDVLATQCAAQCAAKARLRQVLFEPAADEAVTGQLLDTMAAAQRACECATLAHIRKVHSLLQPEQRQLFERAVVGNVCGCRTGLHGCQDTGNCTPVEPATTTGDTGSSGEKPCRQQQP